MSTTNHASYRPLNGHGPRRKPAGADPTTAPRPLHRVGEVRQYQRISMRAAQEFLDLPGDQVRAQEDQDCDLRLSELYRWQALLGVPVAELLIDPPCELSSGVSQRAAMVKVMKTAATILDQARQASTRTLAERLIAQLLEIMPELASVAPWPSVGQRRTLHEYGRIAERPVSYAPLDD